MTTAWTLGQVARVREALEKRPPPVAESRNEGLHARAALLSSFRLEAAGFTGEAAETLRADSVPLPTDPARRMLKDPVRRRVLSELRTREALRAARAASSDRAGDPLQKAIDAALDPALPPLDGRDPEQLAAMLQVADWFADTEIAASLPPAAALRAEVERESLLAPLRELGGAHFRGRATELATLAAYVEEAAESQVAHGPLIVFGPGGMGKSSLIARFILEHVGTLPLAYLDCDRPGIVAMEPVTLLAEMIRQLALQFPDIEASATQLRDRWLARVAADVQAASAQGPVTLGRETVMKELGLFLESLGTGKLLLVIDTFEEVQHRSSARVAEIFAFLAELRALLPQLRTVIAGRNPVPYPDHVPLEIGALDPEAARQILAWEGLSAETADKLAGALRGNPLSLRLAAELWKTSKGEGLEDLDRIADEADLQGILYGRILSHLHDETVRNIAHPGLILRRITPALIEEVLAGPCGLGSIEGGRAQELFGLLRKEMSLVEAEGDEAVRHRRDVRSIMLRPLRRDRPDTIRCIEEAAVAYYERFEDPVSRAEEIYHRLSLGQDAETVDPRWMDGIEENLRSAVDELDGAGRAYLAARLGIELYDVDLERLDQATWERIVARQAADLIELDKPLEAAALLRRRATRLKGSPLHWLHAQALRRGGLLLEAREVARIGLGDLLDTREWWLVRGADAESQELSRRLMDWYCGPQLAGPPEVADFDREEKWLRLEAALRRRTGPSFVGRRSELAVIADYVTSPSKASLSERPPLFVEGPGGCGKSALLAHFLLTFHGSFPFAWLSADSLELAARKPLLLQAVHSIASQLAPQLPDLGLEFFDRYGASWSPPAGAGIDESADRALQALCDKLGRDRQLQSGERPLVLVFDQFDLPAVDGADFVGELYSLLSPLQRAVPRLRALFAGRSAPSGWRWEPLAVGALDAQSAEALLVADQVDDEAARATILRVSQGHPLAMRLMIGLYRQEGGLPAELTDELPGEEWEDRLGDLLLARITRHIADPEVAALVPAACLVRRIDEGVLVEVLARPVGLALGSAGAAGALLERLKREAWLFAVDQDALVPRPDVRRLLLKQMARARPDVVRRVHEAAIAYYEHREGLRDRAEELYHRLAYAQPPSSVEDRWIAGVETFLQEAAEELEGPARLYLLEKLGRDLNELDWLDSDQKAWEDYSLERARDLADHRMYQAALAQVRKRSARLPRSELFLLEAEILLALRRSREAMAVVQDGLAGMPDNRALRAMAEVLRKEMGQAEAGPDAEGAGDEGRRLRRVAQAILRRTDRESLVKALATTFPTVLDMAAAWREFETELGLSIEGPLRLLLPRLVEAAAAAGILEDMLVAALAYAPDSVLHEIARRRSDPPRRREANPFGTRVESGLIFNRTMLRRFLTWQAGPNPPESILWVEGPAGSGKSSTARVARRFASELGRPFRIVHMRLDVGQSAELVARNIFRSFDWRWEGGDEPPRMTVEASATRYARVIVDRFKRLEGEEAVSLLILEHDVEGDLPSDVVRMIFALASEPIAPPLIFIGLRRYVSPAVERRSPFIEHLLDFTAADIREGLERFIEESGLDGDADALTKIVLEQAEGAKPYNPEVSRHAHYLIHTLSEKAD